MKFYKLNNTWVSWDELHNGYGYTTEPSIAVTYKSAHNGSSWGEDAGSGYYVGDIDDMVHGSFWCDSDYGWFDLDGMVWNPEIYPSNATPLMMQNGSLTSPAVSLESDGVTYYLIKAIVADTGWIKAVWGNLYGQWLCGAAVFIYDYKRFHALDLIKKVTEHKVDTFCAPPTVFRFLIKEDLSDIDFSSLKHVSTAGESLPPEVFNKFKEITGLEIKEAFGQTETVISIGTFKWLDPKLGSVGRENPNFKIDLLDKDGKIVDIGEEGEICFDLSADNTGLFDEYNSDPERNQETRYWGYYHCGDKAWKDEDGYFHFVGRNDDVIKSSGYRIGPYEVESAVISHPAVVECAITGYPHEVRGQIVKATIVISNDYEESEELKKDIQQHVKKVTAPYKYPRMIDFVSEIPKTSNGKIIRKIIRENDLKKFEEEN